MCKRMTHLVVLLVTVAFLFSMIACSKTDRQPGETTQTTTPTETSASKETTTTSETTSETTKIVEANPFADFYEISWLTGFCDTYEEGAWDELMLEEKYNVDFKVWNISYYDAEGLTMMLAAGDIPDFCYIPYAPMEPWKLYEEGFTRSIPLDMYKKYFPYYYEQMEKNAPSSFKYNNIPGTDEYYGISYIMSVYKTYYNVPLIRLDWLENVGYKIPESELIPITLTDEKLGQYNGKIFMTNHIIPHEEMNDIFRAFTEDDPDGNGVDDTYAAVIFDHSFRSHWVDLYWGQFGLNSSDANYLYLDKTTGDVVPWYAFSGYRDYMIWASKMRDKGYMRTLPVKDDEYWYDVQLATWLTGKVGYFNADRQYICKPDFPEYSDRQPPQSIWLNGDQDATFVSFPALAGPGPEGTWGTKRYQLDAFAEGKWRTWNVAKSVSDGKLARVLTMWNDRYTDKDDDFWVQIIYGIEGVHYKWTGTPWESGMIKTETDKIPPKYRMGGWWGGSFDPEISPIQNEAMSQYMKFYLDNQWPLKYTVEPHKYLNTMHMGTEMYENYTNDWNNVSEAINAAISDFTTRAWNGEIADMNAEWQQYINQLYAAGLEDLINKYYNNEEFKTYQRPDIS